MPAPNPGTFEAFLESLPERPTPEQQSLMACTWNECLHQRILWEQAQGDDLSRTLHEQARVQLETCAKEIARLKHERNGYKLLYSLCGADVPIGFMDDEEPMVRVSAYIRELKIEIAGK